MEKKLILIIFKLTHETFPSVIIGEVVVSDETTVNLELPHFKQLMEVF